MNSQKYTYTKLNHFKYMLEKYQSNSDYFIPHEMLEFIANHAKILNKDPKTLTYLEIKKILRHCNKLKYIDDIPKIIAYFNSSNVISTEHNYITLDKFECPICYNEFSKLNDLYKLECNHLYCNTCKSRTATKLRFVPVDLSSSAVYYKNGRY